MIRAEQLTWEQESGWRPSLHDASLRTDLALAFGARSVLQDPAAMEALRTRFPDVTLIGCSTAGEITGTNVVDGALCVTALSFEHSRVRFARERVAASSGSRQAGRDIARALAGEGLTSVFLLGDGLVVYGPELVAGIVEALPPGVVIAGGLAADGSEFCETVVLSQHGVEQSTVVAVGFYGEKLTVGYGSLGGWDPFGPHRRITRATRNVLHELDGQSALGLYKRYLGEHADALPSAALRFPLCVRRSPEDVGVVRTVLAIDERDQTMTFAGDVPEGGYAQLMRANVDRLVDGALGAARTASQTGSSHPTLAVLISCSGRRMVLRQRVEEEVEAVREVLGDRTMLSGFYSYGEIGAAVDRGACELHNQTMTMITFAEA